MIRRKTLFVVGAGASNEVGLPLGGQLRAKVADEIRFESNDLGQVTAGNRDMLRALQNAAAQTGVHNKLLQYMDASARLCMALPQAFSVDNVIDAHQGDKDLQFVGKLGIAAAILKAEHSSALFPKGEGGRAGVDFGGLNNTWLVKLWQLLAEGLPRAKAEDLLANVAFIVFNYDRCLEHFLLHAVKNYYHLDSKGVEAVMSKLKVLHPYGTVGQLAKTPFGERNAFSEAAKNLRTFTERVEDGAALAWLDLEKKAAETIVFLGFAFHPLNMQLLQRPRYDNKYPQVYATAVGISQPDRETLHSVLKESLGLHANGKAHLSDKQCGSFFDEYRLTLLHSDLVSGVGPGQ